MAAIIIASPRMLQKCLRWLCRRREVHQWAPLSRKTPSRLRLLQFIVAPHVGHVRVVLVWLPRRPNFHLYIFYFFLYRLSQGTVKAAWKGTYTVVHCSFIDTYLWRLSRARNVDANEPINVALNGDVESFWGSNRQTESIAVCAFTLANFSMWGKLLKQPLTKLHQARQITLSMF